MLTVIRSPAVVQAAGNKPKIIEEFIGRVNSKTDSVSIARMKNRQRCAYCGGEPA
jgi:hypothetical protein